MQNTSILLDKSVTLYTFLTKGGEQDESFVMGNENLNGKVSPTLFQLETIAIALEVKITDLFESEYK